MRELQNEVTTITATTESTHNKLTKPQPLDVILGRGKSHGKHPGNMIFQDLVQSNRLRYFESTFAVKRSIIAEIIDTIRSGGGRFVRVKDANWSIAPDETVRLKIAHAIQYHIRTELTQAKEVLSSAADDVESAPVPEQGLSDLDRIVKKLREKISTLKNQNPPSVLPSLYQSSETQMSIKPPAGVKGEGSSSTPDIYVSTPASARPPMHDEVFSKASQRIPVASSNTSYQPVNQSRHCDSHLCSNHIPHIAETDISRLRHLMQSVPINRSPVFNRRTTPIIDHRHLPYDASPHIYPFLERAIADYVDFTQSSEYRYYIGSQNRDHNYLNNIYDTSTNINRAVPYVHDLSTHPQNSFHVGSRPSNNFNNSNNPSFPRQGENNLDLSGASLWDGSASVNEDNSKIDVGANGTVHWANGSDDDGKSEPNIADQTIEANDITNSDASSQPRLSSLSAQTSPSLNVDVDPVSTTTGIPMLDSLLQATSDGPRLEDTDNDSVTQWEGRYHNFESQY